MNLNQTINQTADRYDVKVRDDLDDLLALVWRLEREWAAEPLADR